MSKIQGLFVVAGIVGTGFIAILAQAILFKLLLLTRRGRFTVESLLLSLLHPRKVQWPLASKDGKPQQPRQLGGACPAAVHKEPQKAKSPPIHPDKRLARARVRVGQLESAIKVLDPGDPTLLVLQEALKKAQQQAKTPSLESRVRVAEEYLARKKKRLVEAEQAVVAAVEGRDRFLSEVAEGERSLTKLQEEKQMMEQVLGGPEPAHLGSGVASKFCAEMEQLMWSRNCRHRTRSCAHHPNAKQSGHILVEDTGCGKTSNQCATKTLCSGCEIGKPTCRMPPHTSWRGCARS